MEDCFFLSTVSCWQKRLIQVIMCKLCPDTLYQSAKDFSMHLYWHMLCYKVRYRLLLQKYTNVTFVKSCNKNAN